MTFALLVAIGVFVAVLCCACFPRLGMALCSVAVILSVSACPADEISVAAIARRQCPAGVCATAPPVTVSAIARRQTPAAVKPPVATQPLVQYAPQHFAPQCVGSQCPVPQRRGLFGLRK